MYPSSLRMYRGISPALLYPYSPHLEAIRHYPTPLGTREPTLQLAGAKYVLEVGRTIPMMGFWLRVHLGPTANLIT